MIFIDFRDDQGHEAIFEPISIIDFQGSISPSGQSHGHYISDVQEQTKKHWFRTNDNRYPVPITLDKVSKKAYVVLFKRCQD